MLEKIISKKIMVKITSNLIILFFASIVSTVNAQVKTVHVESFDKIIISPHIEVVFTKGTEEKVIVEEISIPLEKLNIGVNNNTLHVYLEGAKITSPTKKEKKNGEKQKVSIYKGTIAKITVSYKAVETFALRGEERMVFNSPIEQEKCKFNIYGESQVYINKVTIDDLKVTIYGESLLEIAEGSTYQQKLTAYGESTINILNVDNDITRVTAYGDSNFQFNVSERVKITAYGEPTIAYSGKGKLSKGIFIGSATIKRLSE